MRSKLEFIEKVEPGKQMILQIFWVFSVDDDDDDDNSGEASYFQFSEKPWLYEKESDS